MNLPWKNPARIARLDDALSKRILILDGAMGTMIQRHRLEEADYRGERFKEGLDALQSQPACGHALAEYAHVKGCGCDLKGNNDLLTLTRPDIIGDIHRDYLDAGADLIETNTFNSTTLSQADYKLEHLAFELNFEGAKLARRICDSIESKNPDHPRFVVGVLGPTSRTASISPDVNNPGFRATSFSQLAIAYEQAALGLIEGGADVLMVETVFDTLNAKAALFAIEEAFAKHVGRLPVMISGTITDRSGRTLSGQTAEAFWYSVAHSRPHAIGLNCALGAKDLHAHIDILSQVAPVPISCHPNAGLPNAFGEYDETPEQMAQTLLAFAEAGLLNIVGGCCGTTPGHIRAIANAVAGIAPRQLAANSTEQAS